MRRRSICLKGGDGRVRKPACRLPPRRREDLRPARNYLFNASIAGIEEADALLLIGSNPRLEAPVLNARIRKRYLAGDFPIAAIGEATDLTYQAEFIGAGADTLADLLAGKQSFADTLKNAENPMIIVGQGALTRDDGAAHVLASAIELAETGASFNMLHGGTRCRSWFGSAAR